MGLVTKSSTAVLNEYPDFKPVTSTVGDSNSTSSTPISQSAACFQHQPCVIATLQNQVMWAPLQDLQDHWLFLMFTHVSIARVLVQLSLRCLYQSHAADASRQGASQSKRQRSETSGCTYSSVVSTAGIYGTREPASEDFMAQHLNILMSRLGIVHHIPGPARGLWCEVDFTPSLCIPREFFAKQGSLIYSS